MKIITLIINCIIIQECLNIIPFDLKEGIKYIGVNDDYHHYHTTIEGPNPVPNGISYNSYLIKDEKIAIMDTIDKRKTDEWLENLEKALEGRKPDYILVQHMEPDHSGN